MGISTGQEKTIPKDLILQDLGDGLVMRRSAREDVDRLAEFNARIHGDDPADGAAVAAWTRDLLLVPPPDYQPDDFVIVEDTRSGEIVSSLNLISQTWTYEGIPFGVGQPELVGTDLRYRKRGLVRTQFNVIHEWSRQRGHLVQVITGIPYFYRQFGYEMGLELGGGRSGYEVHVPKLTEGQAEQYQIRPAANEDIPWIMKMYQCGCERGMIAAVRTEAHWYNEIFEKTKENVNHVELQVIERLDGQPIGYLAHPGILGGSGIGLTSFELAEGNSFLAVTPAVIRYLWNTGSAFAKTGSRPLKTFEFNLGDQHPAYQAASRYLPLERKPYAYYVRVPDLPAFLRRIAPALEKRLKCSPCSGHTGELKINFYRDGIHLVFESGLLVTAEPWKPTPKVDEGMAAFPNLIFLQMVFGYRTLTELQYAYADCWADDDARCLLDALFPKKYSRVTSIS